MAVFLTAVSMQAATDYGFSVGGVSVNSDNCNNIASSYISNGTASYNSSTNTLTLTNVTITRNGSGNYCIYNSGKDGLKVVFVGTCVLTGNNAPPVKTSKTTYFTASQDATVTFTGKTSNGEGLYIDGGQVYLYGPGTFNINSDYADAICGGGSTMRWVNFGQKVNVNLSSTYAHALRYVAAYFNYNGSSFVSLMNSSTSVPVVSNSSFSLNGHNIQQPVGAIAQNNTIEDIGSPICGQPIVISEHADIYKDGVHYKIISYTNHEVEVTYRNTDYNNYSGIISFKRFVDNYDGISYSVTRVGDNAFRNCTGITELHFGYPYGTYYDWCKISEIGQNAFNGCTNLRKAEYHGSDGHFVTNIKKSAFEGCTSLETIYIPENVTTVESDAFAYCSGATKLKIWDGCTRIYERAFYGCTGLTEIECKATTPPTIGSNTFSNYNASLIVPSSAAANSYLTASYWKKFNTIIPQPSSSNVYDFYVNGIYYHLTGSNTVEVSYATTSYATYKLTETVSDYLEVPSTVTCQGVTYNVTGVRENAFRKSEINNYIELPNSVTSIGDRAFYQCKTLSIGHRSALSSVGIYAFAYSTMETTSPLDMDTIPTGVYYNCPNLSMISLGSKVKYIRAYAFNGCPLSLIDCASLPDPPTCQSTTFSDYTATVVVPNPSSMAKYKAANYWKNFTNFRCQRDYDFVINNVCYTIIADKKVQVTHANISGDILIPATVVYDGVTYNVTAIGDRAFYSPEQANKLRSGGTTDIKSVTMPNTITTIGSEAFAYCEGLTYIVIPSSVTSIGANAFYDCTNLGYVFCYSPTPPTIQSTTFSDLYSLATLVVPNDKRSSYMAATYWKNFQYIKTINTALSAVGGDDISFVSDGTYPWRVEANGSRQYMRSGNYGYHSTTSTMTAQVNLPVDGSLEFDFKAWGEGVSSIFDKCIFLVDGTEQFSYGARDNDWETYSVNLSAGPHTLTWTYSKDSSVNPTGDYFAVDNVRLVYHLENRVWVNDVEASAGQMINIPVYMSNEEPVQVVQMAFMKPTGFNLIDVIPGERLKNGIDVDWSDGESSFAMQVKDNMNIVIEEPGVGVLCYMTLQVPENINGDYEFTTNISGITNQMFVRYVESGVIQLDEVNFHITVNGILGDVTGDHIVDVDDVTNLIAAVVNGTSVNLAAADMNGDGQADIEDVTILINRALGGN